MHNAAFAKLKIDAAYLPFLVQKQKLKSAIAALKRMDISGFNVTLPFKSECMSYLDRIDTLAKAIGAVNTVINKNGKLIGYNTDCGGFIKSLREDLGISPSGCRVFLAGSGGVARSVAFGLARSWAKQIIVCDIIKPKAMALARDIRQNFPGIDIIFSAQKDAPFFIRDCSLFVNCTPLGMHDNDPLPLDAGALHSKLKVYDVVYTPLRTRLIKLCQAKSIQSSSGINMLVYQGVLAFELWTGQKAPVSLMKKELLARLGK
jgi:shikimate dehydrogenase